MNSRVSSSHWILLDENRRIRTDRMTQKVETRSIIRKVCYNLAQFKTNLTLKCINTNYMHISKLQMQYAIYVNNWTGKLPVKFFDVKFSKYLYYIFSFRLTCKIIWRFYGWANTNKQFIYLKKLNHQNHQNYNNLKYNISNIWIITKYSNLHSM